MITVTFLVLSFATASVMSAQSEGKCDVVKVLDKYGSKRTVVYIDEHHGREKADLVRCAEATFGATQYVYIFIDRALAQKWDPVAFGPGPAHKGCIGRAYRETAGAEVMYTPIEEW